IGGAMVLRILTIRSPHQAADRKVEGRRTILALIITIRSEWQDSIGRTISTKDIGNDAVNQCISPPTLFIRHLSRVTQKRKYQDVANVLGLLFISREPNERTYRPWDEQEAIA